MWSIEDRAENTVQITWACAKPNWAKDRPKMGQSLSLKK